MEVSPVLAVGIMAMFAPTIAAIVTAALARRAAIAASKVATAAAANAVEVNTKLDRIAHLTDGQLSEARQKINRLEAKLYNVTGEAPTPEGPAS
jgi:hypothetical protein